MTTTLEKKRFRRRTWNATKPHLPKYSSVPELQLVPPRRPQFHCQRCGFTNTLIPLCLWCTWTSEEAEHEFELSMPRARRASAPPRVFFNNANPRCVRPHDPKNASSTDLCSPVAPSRIVGTHIAVLRWGVQEHTETEHDGRHDVANVTKEPLPPPIFPAKGVQEGDARSPGAMIDLRDPLRPPSPTPLPLSIVRSKSEPMKTLKSSRRLLIIWLHEQENRPTLITNYDSPNFNAPSPPQHSRTLRRKKPLIPNSNATDLEPISISLTLHSTPSKRDMSRPDSPTHSISRDPITPPMTPTRLPPTSSPIAESTNSPGSSPVRLGHPSRPYYTAIRKGGISPSPSRPSSLSGPSPSASTRPQSYQPPTSFPFGTSLETTSTSARHLSMSAMFVAPKGGISPSPSRPSSLSGPSPSASTRPQSYQPPTSFPFGTSLETTSTSARHLSMSAMFVAPSSSQGMFSAFSVMDADSDNHQRDTACEDDEDEEDLLRIVPPTPAPSRFSFSLPGDVHRVARKAAAKSASPHSHSQSLSSARSKARGSGMGFSMSGETELKMALAEDGFRFKETTTPLTAANSSQAEAGADEDVFGRGRSTNLKDSARKGHRTESFMGRVRRLRKGLKDMLAMNSSTPLTPATNPI
ncbi:hypothetical protein M413DRAFT_447276 [Hebeloma cylindrosporum]|uniref:Uncharacterized protein n=1 Tax=Hebeloma cylindrosporum TaxID=76867 RepID=A0A0C3C500_HEBCY|nr:hypothetical protein M413DRAFT_447276 [Hebeloma cylindrosporum h7]